MADPAVPVVDTHVHLASADLVAYPHAPDPPFVTEHYVFTADDLLAAMPAAGVVGATVVQPFGVYAFDNAYHADSARRFPGRFTGVCGVPATPEGPDLVRYWVRERGMTGVRLLTLGQGMSLLDDVTVDVLRTAAALGVPLCVLTSRKHVRDVAGLAARVPEAWLVLDHAGVTGAPTDAADAIDRLEPLAAVDRVVLKLTTPMVGAGEVSRRIVDFALDRFGPSRLIWGSNFPITDDGGYVANVARSREALSFLDPAVQEQVFRRTAEALWPALTGT